MSRRLAIPGSELTHTHSDAWKLTGVPPSLLVIGGGDTGVQIASMFHAFGSKVQLFERGPRILRAADETVAAAVAAALRESGLTVRERFGEITSFEKTATGVRMNFRNGRCDESTEAALVMMAAGWVADTAHMNLGAAGVELDPRGNVKVDPFLQTSAPHIFAAGDVTGRLMLVPGAIEDGFVAATNAIRGPTLPLPRRVTPSGSFTHPEYAEVGLTEAKARETHDVVTALVPFESAVRPIIEGRTFGFCKLVVDRGSCRILGCHVVGERAVEIAQLAAVAIAADMRGRRPGTRRRVLPDVRRGSRPRGGSRRNRARPASERPGRAHAQRRARGVTSVRRVAPRLHAHPIATESRRFPDYLRVACSYADPIVRVGGIADCQHPRSFL